MFSILIPTWNNLSYLQQCVAAIEEHSAYNHQIIVHVNEGNDGSIDFLQQKGIAFTHSAENIGICKALNLIAAKAEYDYLVYMNDDMYTLPGWDTALIDSIKKMGNEAFYLSATMIEPTKGGHNCMLSPHPFGDLEGGFKQKELLQSFASLPFNDWNGASWPPSLVHKNLWNRVGGYSEEFSPGLYSDPDFAMKLWQLGVRQFKGVAASRVYHFQSKSLHRVKLNNGRKQFKQKWGISASYFYKNYLKMGSLYKGKLPEIEKGLAYLWAKLKAKFG